jgi:di/tricarboxylate transporter
MLFVCLLFTACGIITTSDAFSGYANTGLWTVMLLFVVALGIEKTGCLTPITKLLTKTSTAGIKTSVNQVVTPSPLTYYTLGVPVGILSAFLNNTPIVAMLIPPILQFCRRQGFSPSKFMIPLSYFTILGGTITLIGTSTNLVAYSLANNSRPDVINPSTFGLFALAPVGIPVFLAGMLYVSIVGRTRLLPSRIRASVTVDESRDYVVIARVPFRETLQEDTGQGIELTEPKSSQVINQNVHALIRTGNFAKTDVAGLTIQSAGLRNLGSLFLFQIIRGEQIIPAPPPETVLIPGDKLFFAGKVNDVVEKLSPKGLLLESDEETQVDLRNLGDENVLYEAIVSPTNFQLLGKQVRDTEFRARYQSAILSVHRNGERLDEGIGEITLHAHDVLLVLGPNSFYSSHVSRHDDFSLVRPLQTVEPPFTLWKAFVALVALLVPIIISAVNLADFLMLLVFGASLLMVVRIISPEEARDCMSWEVFLAIGMSFGLGVAMTKSGAADLIASGLQGVSSSGGEAALMIVTYIITVIINALVTNNAACAIVWPIIDASLNLNPSYNVANWVTMLCFAGSADFSTPIGYQTNLMVYGPGGYRFLDYLQFGGPLQLLTGTVTIVLCLYKSYWWVAALILAVLNLVVIVLDLIRRYRANKEGQLVTPNDLTSSSFAPINVPGNVNV